MLLLETPISPPRRAVRLSPLSSYIHDCTVIIYTKINLVLVCICAGHFEQILHSSGSVLKLDSTKVVKNHLITLRLHYRLH